MGTTLGDVVFKIGGGMRTDKPFKAVQIGGPSGACLTKEHLDLPLDYDSLKAVGAMVGSGGLGGIFGLASMAVVLVFGWLAILAIDIAALFWTLVAIGIVALIVLGVLSSTLSGIYKAAVYRYASQHQVAPQFDAALIQGAFRVKGAAA